MSPKKRFQNSESGFRRIREQRFVIDALEAELMLCAPDDETRLKERVATERKLLQDLEANHGLQPKSKLISRDDGSRKGQTGSGVAK
jgi:hypothetical protein